MHNSMLALSLRLALSLMLVGWCAPLAAVAEQAQHPKYKPSSRSPEAIDILSNAYGASRSAPNALEIGKVVSPFTLPKAGGGQVSLTKLHAGRPAVLIFYRGHW